MIAVMAQAARTADGTVQYGFFWIVLAPSPTSCVA
jgi:hypothetical protein